MQILADHIAQLVEGVSAVLQRRVHQMVELSVFIVNRPTKQNSLLPQSPITHSNELQRCYKKNQQGLC